ncbi:MAG: aminoacyl-tRNA hydrolase, partial [Candidatus Dadabacteria bacterium]|nr:aminoacyl-tRNA hydrolase [Candidatus Dadabacteria bacterium]
MRHLIAGLGNPGSSYENTRHNIGFCAAERAAERLGVKIRKKKFRSLCAEAPQEDHKVLIIKPQTFMNSSGEAIREAKQFYGIDLERIIVIYDELDLPLGNVRVNRAGGSAGHNGI